MSSFSCNCGAVVRDEDSPDANIVAYPQPVLALIVSRITKSVVEFQATADAPARSAWLAAYFHASYPADEPDANVIEDIVDSELNDGFESIFRCPSCDRLWIFDRMNEKWTSYLIEQSQTDS